jgi:hypothetical protein
MASTMPGSRACSYRLQPAHLVAVMALFAVVPAAAGELFFGVILHLDIPYGAFIWLLIAGPSRRLRALGSAELTA